MSKENTNYLFDILTALFNNKDYINNLTKESINQNIFMINRRLAINYPLQVQAFNNTNINYCDEIYFWRDFLYSGNKKIPYWMYAKGSIKAKEKKESINKISNNLINTYCNFYKISKKDFVSAFNIFNKDLIQEIKQFEKDQKETE